MAPRLSFVIDCADPEKLAAFWAAALGYTNLGFFEPYVILVEADDGGPRLLLQRVDEPKAGKNRMHVDVHVADVHTEADRLAGLGATKGDAFNEFGHDWIVMTDPEGNEFCVCDS